MSNVSMTVTTTEGEVLPPEEQIGKTKHKITKLVEDPTHLGTKSAKTTKAQKQRPEETPQPSKKRQSRTLTSSQIKELQETFVYFDKDKDGRISSKELGLVMQSLGQNPTDSEIRDIINEVDADRNGQLDFEEFVTMMSIHMKTADEMEKELQQAFKVFDANGDGYINVDELRQAMTTIGERMTDKEINDIMKQWDSDGDGKIDYDEFVKAMVSDNVFK